MALERDSLIEVGRIAGLFGVRGWVRVQSHTQPRDNILRYAPWQVFLDGSWRPFTLKDGRIHGKAVVALLEGVADRDQAAALVGAPIAVSSDQLPPAKAGEYYWVDLIGLRVVNAEGVDLGTVDHLMETGANDVLVVRGERERLIPYTPGVAVLNVDLAGEVITVDWDPDF